MWHRYKHKRSPLTQYDQNRMYNSCETLKEKLVVWTLLDTGLRVEELCNMDKNNINWVGRYITVYGKNVEGWTRQGEVKEKKRREVPLTNRVQTVLEAWLTEHDSIKMDTKTAYNIVARVAKRGHITKCSPHVLRHSFAVTSLDKGVSLPALQQILGHESLETTAIYLNLSNNEALRQYREKW